MLRELMAHAPILNLPIVAMLMFLAMFLLVLLRVSRRARLPAYREIASLPLADDGDAMQRRADR
jgi:hypothetical protein